jgi:hypothetical protein
VAATLEAKAAEDPPVSIGRVSLLYS